MRDEIIKFVSIYSFAIDQSQKVKDLGGIADSNHYVWKFFKKLENAVASLPILKGFPFEISGRCGNSGRWLNIPYIRIFDKKNAPGASNGVYVTYLFSDDGKSLVLSLTLGGSGYDKKNATEQDLRLLSDSIANQFKGKTTFSSGNTTGLLGSSARAKNYENGLPLYKKYDVKDLPSEKILENDLKEICLTYEAYLKGSSSFSQSGNAVNFKGKSGDDQKNLFPKNVIFYGAPGTGKTYQTVNRAVAIAANKSMDEVNSMERKDLKALYNDLKAKGRIAFVTFHQSYSYEDFIVGIFPDFQNKELKYTTRSGSFKALCDLAKENSGENFVMIIDEINRGNISKIFGELITLIEKSKRLGEEEETVVTLPYPDENGWNEFGVPSNVYIIGTMNTADRSIQHVDTALRRRFKFEEVLPNPELFINTNITIGSDTLNIKDMLTKMNERIQRYYDREHVIGHSYFMDLLTAGKTGKEALELLGGIFRDNIIPLLQDYFFEDYAKIQKVLGVDDETPENESMIRRVPETNFDDADEGRAVYTIAKEGDPAYANIKTFLHIAK